MKAVVYHRYGPPDVLSVQEVPKPSPKANELLIRVVAAEVVKGDCELRSFQFPIKWFVLPLRLVMGITRPRRTILGGYFAGEVVQVGDSVSRFSVGDRIFGSAGIKMGAYGEFLCVPDSATVERIPSNATYEQAAALPMGGLNAIHFLNMADIQPGTRVLINGAGGSIGCYGVQIAKSKGAIVTAVDSGKKEGLLRSLGADHFIDYQQTLFSQGDNQYDVIFDVVAHSDMKTNARVLSDTGIYLSANPSLNVMLQTRQINKSTSKRASFAFAKETLQDLIGIKNLFEQGAITAPIDCVYSLADMPDAHRRVESEQRVGLVVVRVSESD